MPCTVRFFGGSPFPTKHENRGSNAEAEGTAEWSHLAIPSIVMTWLFCAHTHAAGLRSCSVLHGYTSELRKCMKSKYCIRETVRWVVFGCFLLRGRLILEWGTLENRGSNASASGSSWRRLILEAKTKIEQSKNAKLDHGTRYTNIFNF